MCSVCSCLSGYVFAHKPLMKAVEQSKRLAYNHSLSLACINSYVELLSALFHFFTYVYVYIHKMKFRFLFFLVLISFDNTFM